MANNYISAYKNLIPEAQQQRLTAILQLNSAAAGVSSDTSALESQIQKLISQLEVPLGSPQTQYREAAQYGRISSGDYNSTMKEVFVDLGAMFAQANNISSAISIHANLNDSAIFDAYSALATVANDVAVYQIINKNTDGINSAIFNSFYKNDNTYYDSIYSVYLDSETNSITLPQGSINNALSINGLALAQISTTTYGGGIKGILSNNQATPVQAIDGNAGTFWAEVTMSSQPITQNYNGQTVFGPVCEVVITMYRIELINYIRFNPFSRFPVGVLYIMYKANVNGPWIDLGVTPQSSAGFMDFYFNDVAAKEIKIVINQESPNINTYQVPQSQINNSLLWQQIANEELSIVDNAAQQTIASQDMLDYQSGWQAFEDASAGFKNNLLNIGYPPDYVHTGDISKSIFDAATKQITASTDSGAQSLSVKLYNSKAAGNDKIVTARMYEYVYGAYEIDVKKIWYVDTGIYISPEYKSPGTIVEAELDTVDYTPSGSSIEYQLSTRAGEWVNIIPNGGSNAVSGERLVINPATLSAALRFTTSAVSAVYMNGVAMTAGQYSFSAISNSVSINIASYISSASYTVDYSPSINTGKVSFLGDALISDEQIYTGQASDQFLVSTRHFPFINYSIINDTLGGGAAYPDFTYTGGRWMNTNSQGLTVDGILFQQYYDPILVTVNGFPSENMTDYYKGERPALTQFNSTSYPYYNYFQAGKNLYFNTPVAGLEFKIVYQYLNDWIQLSATLRNNLISNVTQTPYVQSFTIKLRTI